MSTLTEKPNNARAKLDESGAGAPVRLKTWSELREYLAKHLKLVRRGPKGQPIYAQKDLESLNIILPDEE
jgi:hypothetical protein